MEQRTTDRLSHIGSERGQLYSGGEQYHTTTADDELSNGGAVRHKHIFF